MDSSTVNKARTMAELLPGLSGILSKDAMQTFTAKKQPRKTIVNTWTSEKVTKPRTIAEMRAQIQVLKVLSPRVLPQGTGSYKKKHWNSSVKIDKTVSRTAGMELKNNPVRKVLNFQPKPSVPKAQPISRMTIAAETPKFPKPEFRAKKSLHLQAKNIVRISGICNMPETPVLSNKPNKHRNILNKENIPNQTAVNNYKKSTTTPKTKKVAPPRVPDTPLSNESWKSSCDGSFLQKEKEIQFIEDQTKALSEEKTLDNIANTSPPVSTPFKEYRNVQEYFNNSSDMESSALYHDNTIMCFDKPSLCKDNNKREESVIVSLCDLLNKAKVSATESTSTELEDLLEVEKQTVNNIKMIENGIKTLEKIKQSQLKSLHYVQKLLNEKKNGSKKSDSNLDKTLKEETKEVTKLIKVENVVLEKEQAGKPCSVIKSCTKSPTYKIPRRSIGLRKKVFCKSMPHIAITPVKDMGDKALNMYMKMKEQMNFLNTPLVKSRPSYVPDTPAVTSHNLQKQLDKLYGAS